MKLLYPTSLKLDLASLEGFSVSLHPYDVSKPFPDEHLDADILVTWVNTPANLKDAAARLTRLRWIQSLAAGPNDVLSAGFDMARVTLTTGSGLHDHTGRWPGHLGGAQPDRPKDAFRTLRDARVLVWGFGNIAKMLAPYLTALGAQRIRLLPRHAWVVNVGRGTCVDEDALADALTEGRLGGAALDVFETEPLPASSRLWKTPNLVVSPHAGGGRPQDPHVLIAENLRRFLAGQSLKNTHHEEGHQPGRL
ncbi:NAD(P)-binding domain protein [Niveomyces insectorum RCEF 264]|uniref:NAD(P)-binding domain protein n=1 Tax=Niveomyces insectorum RCEF 264 TaxID=1081102 RepID=A0A167QFU3_9HYPO|nr:NAD(P)-binding domain protein [Niveomyces insectorum RCEF 264]